MKPKLHFQSFALGALMAGIVATTIAATGDVKPRVWEYSVSVERELSLDHPMRTEFYVNKLNEKAAVGWETVGSQVISTNETFTLREILFRRLKP